MASFCSRLGPFALMALIACGEGTESLDDPQPAADAGPSSIRDAGLLESPRLVPCPIGWEERTLASGLAFCEPWPAGSPVRSAACPEDWTSGQVEGAPLCLPPEEWQPVVWPTCPSGWRRVSSARAQTCEPYAEGGPAGPCGPNGAHFPGGPGCEAVGTVCPAGDFPEGLPEDRPVIYVLAGAAVGGDGRTPSTPFARLSDALAAIPSNDAIIALGRGTYTEALQIRQSITLWGACPAETVLVRSDPDTLGVISIASNPGPTTPPEVTLRNLRIADSPRPAVLTFSSNLNIIGVVVERTASGVFGFDGTRLDIDGLVVRGLPESAVAALGVQTDVEVDLRHFVFEDNRGNGFVVSERSRLRAQAGAVLGVTSGEGGVGLTSSDSTVELQAVLIDRSHVFGVTGDGLTLADCIVRNTRPSSGGVRSDLFPEGPARLRRLAAQDVGAPIGTSLTLDHAVVGRMNLSGTATIRHSLIEGAITSGSDQAQLFLSFSVFRGGEGLLMAGTSTVEAVLFEDIERGAILVTGQRGSVDARHIVVRDVRVDAVGDATGAQTDPGTHLRLRRSLIERVDGLGVFGLGGRIRIEDSVIRDIRFSPDEVNGIGAFITTRGRANLSRVVMVRNPNAAISVDDPFTRVIAEDLVIRDARREASESRGVQVRGRGYVGLRRVLLEGLQTGGLLSGVRGTTLTATDVVARIDLSLEPESGFGAAAIEDSTMRLHRALLYQIGQAGVISTGQTHLEDVAIVGVRVTRCARLGTCPRTTLGLGLSGTGNMRAIRTQVLATEGCGLFVDGPGALDLRDALFSENEIGACVEIEPFDFTLISGDRIRFERNDTAARVVDLPLPSLPLGQSRPPPEGD